MSRKILLISASVLISICALAFLLPFAFRGKISRFIRHEINNNIRAEVGFSSLDLSLFRHFPLLTISIDSLNIRGLGEFSGDTLLAMPRIEASVNLYRLLRYKELLIRSLALESPRLQAIVHGNGHVNWEIGRKGKAERKAGPSRFHVSLSNYVIGGGYLSYRDEANKRFAELEGIEHSGKGDFSEEEFLLQTRTQVQSANMSTGAVTWVDHSLLQADMDFQVNNRESRFSIRKGNVRLNDFSVNTEGWFLLMNDSSYAMDLRFNTPSHEFKNILSLVPALFRKDYAEIKAEGQAIASGDIKGRYDRRHFPAFHVRLDLRNGSFRYADLPRPVQHINLSLAVDNPDGETDHTVINIPAFHVEIDKLPLDGRFLVKTPVSDPYLDLAAAGKLDLSGIAQWVKLPNGTHLSGILEASLNARGNYSAMRKQKADKFHAGGHLLLSGFLYASNAWPEGIRLNNLDVSLSPQNITINQMAGEYRNTRFSADGTLDNLPAYALTHESWKGNLRVKADQINLNDWMGIVPRDTLNRNRPVSPYLLPAGINLLVNAQVDKLRYDNLDMENLNGSVGIADETLRLNNVQANLLGGSMAISGTYRTRENKQKPDFAFHYEVMNFDIEKTYYAFNTVQKLMPAGKYMGGKISSRLEMWGRLNESMAVDLGSISGDGNMVISEGRLSHFEPLNKLADALSLKQLQELALKDVRVFYSFRNGKVLIDPFTVKANSVDMRIGGSHGFDQSIDYGLALKIPRSVLGSQANAVVNKAVHHAARHGVKIKANDYIQVNVKMGGTITDPLLSTDLKEALAGTASGLKQQAGDLVRSTVDQARRQLKDSVQSVKKELTGQAGDLVRQSLATKDVSITSSGLDSAKKKLEESGKGLVRNLWPKKKSD